MTQPSKRTTQHVDTDLQCMARYGHGVPSQDPDMDAQMPLSPGEMEREFRSTLYAAGLFCGMALGVLLGTWMLGAAGVLLGGALGPLLGIYGGKLLAQSLCLQNAYRVKGLPLLN